MHVHLCVAVRRKRLQLVILNITYICCCLLVVVGCLLCRILCMSYFFCQDPRSSPPQHFLPTPHTSSPLHDPHTPTPRHLHPLILSSSHPSPGYTNCSHIQTLCNPKSLSSTIYLFYPTHILHLLSLCSLSLSLYSLCSPLCHTSVSTTHTVFCVECRSLTTSFGSW